jgi:hypothetical protein
MYPTIRIFWFLAIVIFSFQLGVSSAEENTAPLQGDFSGIDFQNGLLKISVENREFQKILDEVAKKTGIQIVLNASVDKRLTINFDYLPLDKALRRIVRGSNCVFIYRSEGSRQHTRLFKVLIFPKSSEGMKIVLGGSTKKVLTDQAMAMEDMTELEQKMLEEILRNLPPDAGDLKIEFHEALKNMKNLAK